MRLYSRFFLILWTLASVAGFAFEDTNVLPKGVRVLMLRQGFVTEIGNKYSSNYQLGSLDYRTSRRIDSEMIQSINPEFKELVEIMNKEFPAYNLGDKIYLGDLIIEGDPKINYQAPVFAFGVSDRYMVGLVLPIVHFSVDIQARHSGGNNIEQIKANMPTYYRNSQGELESFSERIDDAYQQLADASNLSAKLASICREKSLRCLGTHRQDVLGDIMLVQRYLLQRGARWSFLLRNHLNLPTGPKDDPDSLIDLPIFHRSFLDTGLVSQYNFGRWTFNNSMAYVFNIPDRLEKRVPKYDGDILPEKERTENLVRRIGNTFKYEFDLHYKVDDETSFGMGLQKEWKAIDSYSGSRGYDYNLLTKNTDAELLKIKLVGSFSTVNWFLKKKFPIPMMFSYGYSDIISGKNVERQNLHEITMAVMF